VQSVKRSAIVPYSAQDMFDLVSDIGTYGDFLPWCSGTEILSADADEVVASIAIAYGSLNKSFTTRNRLQAGKMMEIRLVEGPFSHLQGYWHFEPLDETSSKISLDLEFKFASKLIALAVGPMFTKVANSLVDAFCKRAEAAYGKR
jgi:ribosome-associated toxin RatA of RatAB toxin-antitoxin module